MQIIEYFSSEDRARWLEYIKTGGWASARLLAELIEKGAFLATLGEGSRLMLMTDGDRLASFATLAPRDCIDDPALTPWLGFLFTFPEYRMRGCARRLIGHIACLARAGGHEKLYLATDHAGLYEKMGFEYVENRVDVWGDDSRIYMKRL